MIVKHGSTLVSVQDLRTNRIFETVSQNEMVSDDLTKLSNSSEGFLLFAPRKLEVGTRINKYYKVVGLTECKQALTKFSINQPQVKLNDNIFRGHK